MSHACSNAIDRRHFLHASLLAGSAGVSLADILSSASYC